MTIAKSYNIYEILSQYISYLYYFDYSFLFFSNIIIILFLN